MNDNNLRARLEKTLYDHRWYANRDRPSFGRCACHWNDDSECPDEIDYCQYRAHVADVLLSLPGIAIIELPAGVEWAGEDWSAKPLQRDRPFIRAAVESPLFPDGARAFAAALLAAANAAEQADTETERDK